MLETINRLGLHDRFGLSYLSSTLKEKVDNAIVRDVSMWSTYVVRPSQFIHSPDSVFYQGNEEIAQKELDYLIDTRPGSPTLSRVQPAG